jgi:hypothetical protein
MLSDPRIKPSIMMYRFVHVLGANDHLGLNQKGRRLNYVDEVEGHCHCQFAGHFAVHDCGRFRQRRASSNEGAYRQLSVYSEVLSRIRLEYVEEPNIAGVTDGALHGLLESLDANSSYLSADEYKHYKAMKKRRQGQYRRRRLEALGIRGPWSRSIPGGPADKAGIENSDIHRVDRGQEHARNVAG